MHSRDVEGARRTGKEVGESVRRGSCTGEETGRRPSLPIAKVLSDLPQSATITSIHRQFVETDRTNDILSATESPRSSSIRFMTKLVCRSLRKVFLSGKSTMKKKQRIARKTVNAPKRTKIHCQPASPPFPPSKDIPSENKGKKSELRFERRAPED